MTRERVREGFEFFLEFLAGAFWSLVGLAALWYYVTQGAK